MKTTRAVFGINAITTFTVGKVFGSRNLLLLLLALPAVAQAQFAYTTNRGTITITGYTGLGGAVTVPSAINGLPVTSIGDYAFEDSLLTSVTIPNNVMTIGWGEFECTSLASVSLGDNVTVIGCNAFSSCTNLTSVTIPKGVISIGAGAFSDCARLTSMYFEGNAPTIGSSAFWGDPAIIHYLSGTTGWSTPFGGLSTALWNQPPQSPGASLGLYAGLTVRGAVGESFEIQYASDLSNPTWTTIASITLTSPVQLWIDTSVNVSTGTRRFYQVIPLP